LYNVQNVKEKFKPLSWQNCNGQYISNIFSVISWRSVLLVEDTGVTGENHRPDASHSHTLSSTPHHERSKGVNVA